MDFNPILDGLKATYQMELALFIAEEPLRKFATGLPGDVLTEENRRGKFVKFHSTHWALMKDLATEADVSNVTEEGYTRKLRGITYGALVLPLRAIRRENHWASSRSRKISAPRGPPPAARSSGNHCSRFLPS